MANYYTDNIPGDIACRVYNSAAISLTNSTETALTFDTEDYDTNTMHSTVSNSNRITFQTAGKYLVGAQFRWASNATGIRWGRIILNAATVLVYDNPATNLGDQTSFLATTIYNFAVNDYIEIYAFQTSGGNLNVTKDSSASPVFWAHRLA